MTLYFFLNDTIFINLFTKLMNNSEKHDWMFVCEMYARGLVYVLYECLLWDICCCNCVMFYYSSWTSNLVDPASSHTLVSKIKPCMSKYKQFIL